MLFANVYTWVSASANDHKTVLVNCCHYRYPNAAVYAHIMLPVFHSQAMFG